MNTKKPIVCPLPDNTKLSERDLSDNVWAVLASVEYGFRLAEIEDYCLKDLLCIAQPILLEMFKQDEISYAISGFYRHYQD